MNFDHPGFTNEYRHWFYMHGRCLIGNPEHHYHPGFVPFALDIQTLIRCLSDCYFHTDVAQYDDSVDPLAVIENVHNMVGECVCAIGQGQILEHCGAIPGYQPGNLPRRVDIQREAPVCGRRPRRNISPPVGYDVQVDYVHETTAIHQSPPIFYTPSSLLPPFGVGVSSSHAPPTCHRTQ